MTYLLDSNVFIEAKQRYYGFDFCPAFWAWLDDGVRIGRALSIEAVHGELKGAGDELTVWANDRPGMFLKPDTAVVRSLGQLGEWANGAGYGPAAVSTFLQVADFYLVAHAHAHGFVVVTQERAGGLGRKKIKIPEACIALDVRFMNTFEMLRAERARFMLGETPDLDRLFT